MVKGYMCVCSVMSDPLRPCRLQSTRPPYPWDLLGKNTGVVCRFLTRESLPSPEIERSSPVSQSAGGSFTIVPPGRPRRSYLSNNVRWGHKSQELNRIGKEIVQSKYGASMLTRL